MNYLGYFGKVLKNAFGTQTSIFITLLFVVSLMINIALLFSHEVSLKIGTGLASVGITTVAMEMNTKLDEQRKAVSKITERIERRIAIGAVRNAASIFGEAIPFYGIAIILGVTTLELRESCLTMKDMKEINVLIGSETELEDVEDICGLKIPNKEEVIETIMKSPREVWEAFKEGEWGVDIPSWSEKINEITGFGNYIKKWFQNII
ncbi:MAG: hypothetical protein OXH65_14145 [Paracoccaceae bacterium]|nr:hypothetical protein [Paracoccaceae bacterium]MDE2676238.1 hypothetical protein [Paracoccaceae bacterium]